MRVYSGFDVGHKDAAIGVVQFGQSLWADGFTGMQRPWGLQRCVLVSGLASDGKPIIKCGASPQCLRPE